MIRCKPLSQRKDVIEAIDGELEYQSTLMDRDRADYTDNGVAGQLVTLQDYTSRAMAAWTQNAGDEQALDVLRKCAAIAVRALICYGCPRRAGYERRRKTRTSGNRKTARRTA